MAYSWTILKAAVEQVILFPSERVFETYCHELNRKQEPFELLASVTNPNGSVTAKIRKRYNQNEFLEQNFQI